MLDWNEFRSKFDMNIFKTVFKDCLAVTNEKVLIVGDYGSKNNLLSPLLTNAYAFAARELGLDYSVVLQNSKAREDVADEVMISTLKRLPQASTIILTFLTEWEI